ncbi:MAG: hypothetical protein SGBAC_009784 [Bacillariaceae sp.]
MSKRVAFTKEDDEVGEPSVEIYMYDYCDSQSVVSEAVSIDLSLIKEQKQRKDSRVKSNNKNGVRGSRGHEAGMGKLLKRGSITSEVSQDVSSADNSFWDNEDNSFAEYANMGNQQKGGRSGSGKLTQRASITSEVSGIDGGFWNNEDSSFADYVQFGGQNYDRRSSGSFRLTDDIRFGDDDASLSDSMLSMGSFALDGGVEIVGFDDLKDGEAPSKAAMLDGSGESWSIAESLLKDVEAEEDLNDSMPMRRADRRAQRARDRVSAYSRTPSRNGSIGSISTVRRNGSLGKYSNHSHGSMSLSSVPKRNGSLGKYSDHSLGAISQSSGPRRNGSLGKYSNHSAKSLNSRQPSTGPMHHRRNGSVGSHAGVTPKRNGSIGSLSTKGIARTSSIGKNSGHGIGRPSRRNDMLGGKSQSSRAGMTSASWHSGTGGALAVKKAASADVTPTPEAEEEGSPTVRQRNTRKSESKKDIVSPKVTKAMRKKLGSDLPSGAVLSPTASKVAASSKSSRKIKMGKDSDQLPRSASLRQQLLG